MASPDSATKRHNALVAGIADQIRTFHARGVPFRVFKGSTNCTRDVQFEKEKLVNISGLCNLLSVDTATRTAIVEPSVAMDELVRELASHGLMPKVVLDFPGISVGGAFSGTAAESSSFKFGWFDRSVNWVEIVLGNGEVVRASPTERSDLFLGSIGSMGTMGIVTLLELQLIERHEYVKVTYHPVKSAKEALATLDSLEEGHDYLDGILFSNGSGVVIAGTSTLEDPKASGLPVQQFTRRKDPWFFIHAHQKVICPNKIDCTTCFWTRLWSNQKVGGAMTELVPIDDYLFRYDRGSFWMGAYGQIPLLFSPLYRRFTDPLWKTRFAYKFLHASGSAQRTIIQDLAIPRRNAATFLEDMDDRLSIYPLWLLPIKHDSSRVMQPVQFPPGEAQTIINIGVWGFPKIHRRDKAYFTEQCEDFGHENRWIEYKTTEAGGFPWLYARRFYTEDEFWHVYDKNRYEALRRKWSAEKLPNVWDKVQGTQMEWKDISILRGFMAAVGSRDSMLLKK
jgi:delta24-sterol reductase